MSELVFLKLGGSLITEKTKRYTPRLDKLESLSLEIRSALEELPSVKLVLGHGSGSFGHYAVQEHLNGRSLPGPGQVPPETERRYWAGFSEVWYRASELNRHVMDAMHGAGVPAMAIAPSSAVTTSDGEIVGWDTAPVRAALKSGILPIVFGDIVFDQKVGGKVLSTEALMWHLALELRPQRILLAGLETAVWADFPERKMPIKEITPGTFGDWSSAIGGSHGPDVTGGMKSKVAEMLALVEKVPGLMVQIFSGEDPGNIRDVLAGERLGTLIAGD